MKKAIITGSTGLVGTAVTRLLRSKGVHTLCLGRKPLSSDQTDKLFGKDVVYLNIPMNQIDSLPSKSEDHGWKLDENTVFFNFAWSGSDALTDGEFNAQLDNAIYSAEAVKVAKRMKCSKFIGVGSIQESFLEEYLKNRCPGKYQSSQTYYGLSKLASRNACALIAYLEKIDYVHTRMSVPLAPNLSRGGYVASTMMKIFRNQEYEAPTNASLFDIVILDEVALAFYLIGCKGQDKANYFIGTGSPRTLEDYFCQFRQLCIGNELDHETQFLGASSQYFDIKPLRQDTGFVSSCGLNQILSTLRQL